MGRKQNTKIQARLPYKLYYFVCEDEKSMPYYLKGLKQKYDGKIIIKSKTSRGKNVLSIQKEAKKLPSITVRIELCLANSKGWEAPFFGRIYPGQARFSQLISDL